MEIVMQLGEDHLKKNVDWDKMKFTLMRNYVFEEEEVDITFYEEREKRKLANFGLCLRSSSVVGIIERLTIFDKTISQTLLLQHLLDYLYNLESPYFRILGLFCNIKDCGITDFSLQSVGFYTNDFFNFFHLHPDFLEVLNRETCKEEIKEKFRSQYVTYCKRKEKYISSILQQLECAKEALEFFELECDQQMAVLKRQDIEQYETILNANEIKGFSR